MLLDVQRAATCDIFVSNSDPTDSLFRSESAVRPWQFAHGSPFSSFSCRISQRAVGGLTASSAQNVRLVVTLTEAGGTLRCRKSSAFTFRSFYPRPGARLPSRKASRRTHFGGCGWACG